MDNEKKIIKLLKDKIKYNINSFSIMPLLYGLDKEEFEDIITKIDSNIKCRDLKSDKRKIVIDLSYYNYNINSDLKFLLQVLECLKNNKLLNNFMNDQYMLDKLGIDYCKVYDEQPKQFDVYKGILIDDSLKNIQKINLAIKNLL